jgi:signal peptidase II
MIFFKPDSHSQPQGDSHPTRHKRIHGHDCNRDHNQIRRRAKFFALVALLINFFDRVTKWASVEWLKGQASHSYLYDSFRLEYAENRGAFLSFGASFQDFWRVFIFTGLVGIILVWALLMLIFKKDLPKYEVWGFTLLISGGLGNLYDRIAYGFVIDFVQVGIGPLRTGIFNIADMSILFGVFILLFGSFFLKKNK